MKEYCGMSSASHKRWSAILLVAFLGSVYFFAASGLVGYSRYISIVFALPLSFLFVLRMQKGKAELRQISSDDKEIRKILDRHLYQNMAYRYGDRNKAIGNDRYGAFPGFDLFEVISSPLVILLCLCIASITFIEPVYLEFDPENVIQLLRLFLISIFQLILFSAAFDGLFLFFKNRGGDK